MEFLVCTACLKSPPQHFNAAVSSSHASREGEPRAPSLSDCRGLSFLVGSSSRSLLEPPCWCFRGVGDYFLASCSLLNLLGQLYRSRLTDAVFWKRNQATKKPKHAHVSELHNSFTAQTWHLSGFFGGEGDVTQLYTPPVHVEKRVTVVCIKRMIYL